MNEKRAWENAKLLAVLVYSLIGDHTSGELNDGYAHGGQRDGKKLPHGRLHSPKAAERYLSKFKNANGKELTNPIGDRDNYERPVSGKSYIERKPIGQHVFYKSTEDVYK